MARIGRRGSRSPARARGSIARGFGSLRFAGLCPEGIDRPSTPLGGFDRISRFKSWPNLIGGTSCPRSRHPYLLRAWFRRSGIAQPTGVAGLDRMLLVARAAVARTYLKAWERHVGNRRASRGRSSRLAIRGRDRGRVPIRRRPRSSPMGRCCGPRRQKGWVAATPEAGIGPAIRVFGAALEHGSADGRANRPSLP